MSEDAPGEAIIRNPSDPSHFMALKPVKGRVRIRRGGAVLAQSDAALWVIEIGRSVLDPVVYAPRADLRVALIRGPRASHCPLKGDASYFGLAGGPEDIAWAYETPLPFAHKLAPYVAFHPSQATIEISGAEA
ncbi:MAG: DUF427 domain-containing protein [Pseudomonadota bacterium]